jgi:hypothetical protein
MSQARAREWHRSLSDHLVGLEEERRGNGQSQGLDGLEVDHELERGGLLHGEISRLGAFEELVDVGGRPPISVRLARPIGHQAPGRHRVSPIARRGQSMLDSEVGNASAQRTDQQRILDHTESRTSSTASSRSRSSLPSA